MFFVRHRPLSDFKVKTRINLKLITYHYWSELHLKNNNALLENSQITPEYFNFDIKWRENFFVSIERILVDTRLAVWKWKIKNKSEHLSFLIFFFNLTPKREAHKCPQSIINSGKNLLFLLLLLFETNVILKQKAK